MDNDVVKEKVLIKLIDGDNWVIIEINDLPKIGEVLTIQKSQIKDSCYSPESQTMINSEVRITGRLGNHLSRDRKIGWVSQFTVVYQPCA